MSGDGAGLLLDWACQRTCARERWGREMPDCSLSQAVHSALHPEKPWFPVSGRGFDSRHLHPCGSLPRCSVLKTTPDLRKRADQALSVMRTQRVMSRLDTPEELSHSCHRWWMSSCSPGPTTS